MDELQAALDRLTTLPPEKDVVVAYVSDIDVLIKWARKVANAAGTIRVQAYPAEGGLAGGREVRSDVMGPWAGADGIGTELPVGEYLIIGITKWDARCPESSSPTPSSTLSGSAPDGQ